MCFYKLIFIYSFKVAIKRHSLLFSLTIQGGLICINVQESPGINNSSSETKGERK